MDFELAVLISLPILVHHNMKNGGRQNDSNSRFYVNSDFISARLQIYVTTGSSSEVQNEDIRIALK